MKMEERNYQIMQELLPEGKEMGFHIRRPMTCGGRKQWGSHIIVHNGGGAVVKLYVTLLGPRD